MNGLVDSFHSLYVSGNSPQPENREDFHSIRDGSPILVNLSSDNNNAVEIFDSSHDIKKELSSSSSSSSGSSNESESFHDILEALHSDDNWSVGSDDESLPLGAPWDHCIWTRHKPITKSGRLSFFPYPSFAKLKVPCSHCFLIARSPPLKILLDIQISRPAHHLLSPSRENTGINR